MWKVFILVCVLSVYDILNSKTVAITQDFYWRDYIPGDIPCDAVYGDDGKYIGQVNYNGNLVATIYTHINEAVVDGYGKRRFTKHIKILCSSRRDRFDWEEVDFSNNTGLNLGNIVRGGYQDYPERDLFIGKIYHEQEWKIGRVVANLSDPDKGIWIWNKEENSSRYYQFQILTYKLPRNGCDITTNEDFDVFKNKQSLWSQE